jgi:hypothetical protein
MAKCWKCRGNLVELLQPIDGWRHHCPTCQHLTLTRAEADAALLGKAPDALGVVVAVKQILFYEVVV